MSLKFDGKSNWKAFYAKFSSYAEVSAWTEGECGDQVCWCLDRKASEYYALLVERNHDMAYKDLIIKLEKLFPRRVPINSLMVMLMPPHFVNGLFNVFRPDIGCIASSFLICCPLAEPHYLLLVHVVLW
jgi:hypothetical protein